MTGVKNRAKPDIVVQTAKALTALQYVHVETAVRGILNLTLNLKPFYDRIEGDEAFRWAAKLGAGRFLCGATFFEDAVKMILTTNCSWSLTTKMTENLIALFGGKSASGMAAFPEPEALAEAGPGRLRNEAKLGYRAPYVYELAMRVASGNLPIEAFRSSNASSADMYKELRSIKGVGDYAAGSLLKLLGKYDNLALDSWCRAKFAEIRGNGMPVSDTEIEKHYAPFEEWKGLALWLDLTRQWYFEKFPL